MKNSCPQWDSNRGPSAYEANALSVELLELIYIEQLKVTAFYLNFLCTLPVPRVRCSKMCCRVIYTTQKKQNRSIEECSKLKRSVDMTSSGKHGVNIRINASPKWDRTRRPEEQASSVG